MKLTPGKIFTAGLAVFSNLMITEGMGYHLYDIHFSSLSQMKDLVIWYYICQIFYLLIIYFIKVSILFLYLRIFPEFYHFRFQVIGTMVFVTVAVVIIVPMVIWQCVPVHAIWEFKREDARCLSISGVAYASAAVNIFTEVLVLILPLPLLQTLRASRTQKIALYLLFGCGIIVIGVAAARIPSLSHVEDTHDPTYLNAGVIYWTAAETAVAHLCAAALAVRPLYVKCRNDLRRRKKKPDSTSTLAKLPGACVPEIDTNHVVGGYSEGEVNHSLHDSDAIGGYNPTSPLSKSTTEELESAV
ncbi:hypothetical protein N7478_006638 [Penicillium angulare]|uniref:uncharacterized protein n=1 Tax=Penicillium angulare TaxID=116970 RepID=UPI00253FE671|nr:uncharacterized protein N7478_006638 [Penicillium angulare]KAJ5281266.1 hypothetical protein N7478_006638 [Penicillium angulare]